MPDELRRGPERGPCCPSRSARPRLADCDIVVCSTSAPATIISAEGGPQRGDEAAGRPGRCCSWTWPCPANVDPAVASAGNVFLYNLDDLARIAEKERRLARMVEAEQGRQVLVPAPIRSGSRSGCRWRVPCRTEIPPRRRPSFRVGAPRIAGIHLSQGEALARGQSRPGRKPHRGSCPR